MSESTILEMQAIKVMLDAAVENDLLLEIVWIFACDLHRGRDSTERITQATKHAMKEWDL